MGTPDIWARKAFERWLFLAPIFGRGTTPAHMGLGPQKPLQRLAHWVGLTQNQPLSQNQVFQKNFSYLFF